MKQKYNEIFIRVIEDDQVNFNYMFYGENNYNHRFHRTYMEFITQIHSVNCNFSISKEHVKIVTEALLSKHADVLKVDPDAIYAVQEVNQAKKTVLVWLEKYKPLNATRNGIMGRGPLNLNFGEPSAARINAV